ncbi:YutD family protein [Alkalibacterium putridalgicola]|uniref:YutD family protein n=1 Tax=Alkalibacterium putridalgicola TaxID=426703 RepID=UPI0034CF798E
MSNQDKKDKQPELSTDALDKVINPEDKTVKKIDSDHISIKDDKYKIVKNYREALDLELLEERYSDFLEKYDYIVGDMSYGKLRLRGFYQDEVKKIPIDMRISYLEDYLLEYCSFGCAYFVLENLEPNKKQSTRQYESSSNTQSQSKGKKNRGGKKPYKKKKASHPSKKSDKKEKTTSSTNSSGKRSFTKKNRNKTEDSNQKKEEVKEVKSNSGKTRFQIRKKKD